MWSAFIIIGNYIIHHGGRFFNIKGENLLSSVANLRKNNDNLLKPVANNLFAEAAEKKAAQKQKNKKNGLRIKIII